MSRLKPDLGDTDRLTLERRLVLFLVTVVVAFAILATRLVYLQIVRGSDFEALARGNRIRLISLTAPRGTIVDRGGELLATSRPVFAASLVYMEELPGQEMVSKLEAILGLEPGRIREMLDQQRERLYLPVRIKTDLTPEEHTELEEHRNELPGLVIEVLPIREYVQGDLAAHALGHVGFLNTETSRQALQLQADGQAAVLGAARREQVTYQLGEMIGLLGLERQYDALLRGIDGTREVEVDNRGTPIKVEREVPPTPGLGLRLTLDFRLQRALEDSLRAAMERVRLMKGPTYATSAAAVVLDVRTGAVRAMTSLPEFDPNWFAAGGVDKERLPYLEDPVQQPWLNRALQGLYVPGSTYKMVTASAVLEEGLVSESDRVYCGGGFRMGGDYFKCWVGKPGHGSLDLRGAIQGSCNSFFLEMGTRLRTKARTDGGDDGGVDILADYAVDLGLSGPTGIDLPFERAGMPPRTDGQRWLPGEDVQSAIGQAKHEYSPLQLAGYTACIAAGGQRYRPYLVEQILAGDEVVWSHQAEPAGRSSLISEETFDLVRQGMLAVTQPGGTAYGSFWNLPVRVGGKTGTAQTGRHPDDALFVGFAPFDDPEIAWAIVVSNGDSGALACAPVAAELVRTYFGLGDQRPWGAAALKRPATEVGQ
jgi:penicillin-binding protein 2